jgi:hypothetical protein
VGRQIQNRERSDRVALKHSIVLTTHPDASQLTWQILWHRELLQDWSAQLTLFNATRSLRSRF